MKFYTQNHQYYCGIDLHARSMCVCIFDQDGNILLHRNFPTNGECFLSVVASYRSDLVVAMDVSLPGIGWPISVPGRAFRSSSAMPSA